MSKNKDIKDNKLTYQELYELYDFASSELESYVQYERTVSKELRYLKDFIQYKRLDEEFAYFNEHAIEDPNYELPFPPLFLK